MLLNFDPPIYTVSSCIPTIDDWVDLVVSMMQNQIFNVRRNNKNNFVPDLIQVKLTHLQTSFIPRDKPLKYIHSPTSKQEAVPKRFY